MAQTYIYADHYNPKSFHSLLICLGLEILLYGASLPIDKNKSDLILQPDLRVIPAETQGGVQNRSSILSRYISSRTVSRYSGFVR